MITGRFLAGRIDKRIYVDHTHYMTSTQKLTEARTNRDTLVATAEKTTGRKAAAAWRAVELADRAVTFALGDVEREIRVANRGATEARIQNMRNAA